MPVCGPECPIRATAPAPVARPRAVLVDFSGTLFQIQPYEDRIRAALPDPVDEPAMYAILTSLEAGLSDPAVIEAQHARDVSSRAHRHAFTTWYASAPALAPVADVLYEQLRSPEYWLPYADTLMVGDHPAKDGGAAGAGLRSYALPGREHVDKLLASLISFEIPCQTWWSGSGFAHRGGVAWAWRWNPAPSAVPRGR
nr:hypothetical protein [Streptomyces sp. BA2]